MASTYPFQFFRAGDVDQVLLKTGADIAHLAELDQKLWMALAMPIKGVEVDARTAALLDTDKDGRLRPPEILEAAAFATKVFKSLDPLFAGGDSVPLANIADADLLACAKQTLTSLGKGNAAVISLADVSDTAKVFAGTVLNGDGIVTPESTADAEVKKAIEDLLTIVEPVMDRSGKPGIDQVRVDAFFTEAEAYEAWAKRGEVEADLMPAGAGTAEALATVAVVRAKLDDYFARCRLASFEPGSSATMNGTATELAGLGNRDLNAASLEIRALPLARIEAGRPLSFDGSVNPAWSGPIAAFQEKAVASLLGAKTSLTEADWVALQAKIAPAEAWHASRPAARVEKLGLPRLRELLSSGMRTRVTNLVAQDQALEKEFSQLEGLEKLIRLQRDFVKLLTNFVNFADFYSRKGSTFQVGTLYLDARACELCIEVGDPAKHAVLASLSAAYIAYCDLTRPGEAKRSIAAIFTNGDSANLMVARNGVFYDRQGRDWDATITKIVSNPISIRESFWLPYQRLMRMIDEQISKRAQAADAASSTQVSSVATAVANADAALVPAAATKPPAGKPLDLGTIALLGTALGGVSALVGGFLNMMFGLGLWMPVGFLGIILLISGPSMLLAFLKLRQRNLGPLLDANGWAINTRAKLNVPLGAALTRMATPPRSALVAISDPYASKRRPWLLILVVAAIVGLGYAWLIERLDGFLPAPLRAAAVLHKPVAAPAPPTAPHAP